MTFSGRPKMSRAHLPATVGAFLDRLTERGATFGTRSVFESDLMAVCAFLTKKDKDINTATTDDLQAFLSALGKRKKKSALSKGSKMTIGTIDHHIGTLRRFFGFLVSEGKRTDDPMFAIASMKRRRQNTLSKDEVAALFSTAQKQDTSAGVRLAALLEIFYTTNLRVSDIVGLTLSAIGPENRCLTVEGKGGYKCTVSLPEPAQKALKAYIDIRARFLAADDTSIQVQWLFPSPLSESGHLSSQHFVTLLQQLSRRAGINPKHGSAHALHYAFAIHSEAKRSGPMPQRESVERIVPVKEKAEIHA